MQYLNAIYTSIVGINSRNAEQTETTSSVTSQVSTMEIHQHPIDEDDIKKTIERCCTGNNEMNSIE